MKRALLVIALGLALGLVWLALRRQGAHGLAPEANATSPPSAASADEVARAPGNASPSAGENSTASARTPTAELAAPASSVVLAHGTVTTEEGILCASFGIVWIDDSGKESYGTGRDGSYAVPGLHPGRYLVVVWEEDLQTAEFDAELAPTPPVQTRDFRVHTAARVAIRLRSTDGTPLLGSEGVVPYVKPRPGMGLHVRATLLDPGTRVVDPGPQVALDSECGRFQWASREASSSAGSELLGELMLTRPAPLYVSLVFGDRKVAVEQVVEPPAEIVFTLDPQRLRSLRCGLRARLLEEDRRTPARGRLVVNGMAAAMDQADEQGNVELADLLPGAQKLRLEVPQSAGEEREVFLEPGQVLDLGDVSLGKTHYLRTHFRFPDSGEPPVAFEVLKVQGQGPIGVFARDYRQLNSSGGRNPAFSAHPGPGEFELVVRSVGDGRAGGWLNYGALPVRFSIGEESQPEVSVTIEPTFECCLRPPAASAGRTRWLVRTKRGQACRLVEFDGRRPRRVSLPRGDYTASRVDPTDDSLGPPQPFSVGPEFAMVVLAP